MNECHIETAATIYDDGIEKGAAKLDKKTIAETFARMMAAEGGARLKTYLGTCMSCGMCSDACHYYLSHDKDPHYAPAGKVRQTLNELVKHKGRVSPAAVGRMCEIAFTECNLCRRCMMYCPFGIDVAYLMLFVRRFCHKLGVVPKYIQDTAHSHSATMNQMWVQEDEWIDTLQWQEEEARDEIPNLRIPIDKNGADIFYSVIGPEPKFRAQLIYQAAVIMHAAGMDWTMPSQPGWDNSDMCMYTGDAEMTARLKKVHFEAAMELKTKRIVMGECGHAFRSVYDVGNRFLGWKNTPLPVVHAVAFYDELFREGRLTVAQKFDRPVTLHDPCNIIRGRGLHEQSRNVVGYTCETFIEMEPNREYNYCCAAGGGVINCGPPFKKKRVESNRTKADQLKAAREKGAEVVIAPCHNCHGGLEDIINHYELGMELKFLGDIIYDCIDKPSV
ncbi:MAG: electron transfer complex ferredoxin TmcB [Thermodesulfobacteriota bacterium]